MIRNPLNNARANLAGALVILALLAPLVALAYIGLFTRYMADDYCTAAIVHQYGFINSQVDWYWSWTGRFSYSFMVAVAGLLGSPVVPFLPLTVLVCWVCVTGWSAYQIALMAKWPRPLLTSMVLAELIVFATLDGTHHVVQSLYWQSGMLNYTIPLVILTIYVGVVGYVLRRRRPIATVSPPAIAALVLTLVAGGFTEAYMFVQTGGLLIGAVVCYKAAPGTLRRAALPLVIAGLAGALIATCIVVLAPGNLVRQSHFAAPPNSLRLVQRSFYYAAGFIPYTILRSPLTTLLSVMLPALLGYYFQSVRRDRGSELKFRSVVYLIVFSLVVGFVLILACTLPGVYGTSGFLPERARLIPQFVIVCVAVFDGYLSGAMLAAWLTALRNTSSWPLAAGSVALVTLLILSPIAAARKTFALRTRAEAGAAVWDQMDRDVRAAKSRGGMDLVVPAVDDVESRLGAHRTELQIERDPRNWKNKCVAEFYGVNSITGE